MEYTSEKWHFTNKASFGAEKTLSLRFVLLNGCTRGTPIANAIVTNEAKVYAAAKSAFRDPTLRDLSGSGVVPQPRGRVLLRYESMDRIIDSCL
ncbi:MAG TPA: hypothetical protein DEQ47_06520 [Solibacterales bacterium]|nr:hypothetical protein [Bryobacterales bacterium]